MNASTSTSSSQSHAQVVQGHTPGPYSFRVYATDDDPNELRKHGLEPVRLFTNEGQIAIMAGTGDDKTRVALIDCQTKYKRGTGHKTDCPERDANATLIAAAPDMLAALKRAAFRMENAAKVYAKFSPDNYQWTMWAAEIRAVIAKAEGSR